MQDLTASVGKGGANKKHDVTLVQALLRVIKSKAGQPYLAGGIDGSPGDQTYGAITRYQADKGLIHPAPAPGPRAASPRPGIPGPALPGASSAAAVALRAAIPKVAANVIAAAGLSASDDMPGLVKPDSPTWKQLVADCPTPYAKLRVIEGERTPYLEMDATAATASAKSISDDSELDEDFRSAIAQLVNLMYERHAIVLSTPPKSGRRRTFAQQQALDPATTNAGPGESNHQYGQAVDIGLNGLRIVNTIGSILTANYWLDTVGLTDDRQQGFWNARNKIAFDELGLFPTKKKDDDIHIQAYDDASVSYGKSLTQLLNGVGETTWECFASGHHWHYKSDLGLGGPLYDAGTAREIYAGNATITKANLAAARTAKEKKPITPANVTDKELADVKALLKADFDAADEHWTEWEAVK